MELKTNARTNNKNNAGYEKRVRFMDVAGQVYGGIGVGIIGEKDAFACRCGSLRLERGICDEGAVIVECPTLIIPQPIGLSLASRRTQKDA